MEVIVSDKVSESSMEVVTAEILYQKKLCHIIVIKSNFSLSLPQDETFEPKTIKDVSQSLDDLDTEDLYTKYKVSRYYPILTSFTHSPLLSSPPRNCKRCWSSWKCRRSTSRTSSAT